MFRSDLSRRFKGEVQKVKKIRQDSGRLLIEISSRRRARTPASIRHSFRDLPICLRFRSSSDVLDLMYHHPIISLYSLIARFRLRTCHRSITHHTDVAFTLFAYFFHLSFASTILDFLIDPPPPPPFFSIQCSASHTISLLRAVRMNLR